jgi:hypothetical protein
MANDQYIYQDRAVVFLDVLGFQDKLREFQTEAVKNKEEQATEFFVSEGVNDFINTFKSVVGFLDENNFNYYLFSDNICITIDYVEDHNRLIDVLITINDLFFKFAEKGHFLRGGLDVGMFIDEKNRENKSPIAVGVPLATAYKIEQDVAVYPRIVLSDAYKKLLDSFEENKSISEDTIAKKNLLIKQHYEIYYINTFFNLINNEDKIELLEKVKLSIEENLVATSKEKVAIKYEWLAIEFNRFINEYISDLKDLETDFVVSDEEIEKMKSLKIKVYAK